MFRARERGMSFWPFAISLLLLIVLVIMWFSATSERDQWKASFDKAQTNQKAAEAERDAANKRLVEASTPTGYTAGGSTISADAVKAAIADTGGKLGTILSIEFPASRYQESGDGGKIEKTDAGKVTVVYLTAAELAEATTLEGFVSKFEMAASRMKNDIMRAFATAETATNDKVVAAAAADAALKDKDKRIAELTGEKAAVETAAGEKERELKDSLAQKDQKITQVESDLEAARKQASTNEAKLIAQVSEAQGQVRTLVQRDAPAITEGPDGEVMIASDGMAIINRGRAHWLMPGTIFQVMGRAKGGATYPKGEIKITSVDDETARGAILAEGNSRDPITRGDLIQSLAYSPNRKMHFVLIGDFKKMGRSQAEALLRKLGAVVDDKVTSETNYLVVGLPASGQNLEETEQYKAAKDLGTRILTEEQLGTFARY
jgi:NAD-dependent DNA ligase